MSTVNSLFGRQLLLQGDSLRLFSSKLRPCKYEELEDGTRLLTIDFNLSFQHQNGELVAYTAKASEQGFNLDYVNISRKFCLNVTDLDESVLEQFKDLLFLIWSERQALVDAGQWEDKCWGKMPFAWLVPTNASWLGFEATLVDPEKGKGRFEAMQIDLSAWTFAGKCFGGTVVAASSEMPESYETLTVSAPKKADSTLGSL